MNTSNRVDESRNKDREYINRSNCVSERAYCADELS